MKTKSANHSSGSMKAPATHRKKRTIMPSSSSIDENDEAVVVSTDDEAVSYLAGYSEKPVSTLHKLPQIP
jgi:hypothetical protein